MTSRISYTKVISYVLLVSFILPILIFPKSSQALDVDIDVPNLIALGVIEGAHLASFGTPIESNLQDSVTNAAGAGCDVGTGVAEAAGGWINSISGGFQLIAGNAVESGKLTALASALQARIACFDVLINGLKATSVASGFTYRQQVDRNNKLLDWANQREEAKNRLNQVQALLNASTKDFLRAIITRIILNLSKAYTTKYVNALVYRYRIPKYLNYAEVLGTQVYAMDYIRKNYQGDAQQQMILRSIIQSDYLNVPERIQTARTFVKRRAEQNLGYDPLGVTLNDPYFEAKMARVGEATHNWITLEMLMEDKAEAARNVGMATAQTEIQNSNGFLSTRSCGSAVAEQRALDLEINSVAQEYENAEQIYKTLQSGGAAKEELNKAQEAMMAQEKRMSELPNRVSEPIIKMCDVINSPGGFIAESTQNYLQTYLEQQTDLKSENLPFFLGALADMASNLIFNILPGGDGRGAVTLMDDSLGLATQGIGEWARNIPTPKKETPVYNKSYAINFEINPESARPGTPFSITVDLSGLAESDGPFQITINSPPGEVDIGKVDIKDQVAKPEKVIYDAVLPQNATPGKSFLYNVEVRGSGFIKVQQLQIDILEGDVAGLSVFRKQPLNVRGNTNLLRLR